MQRECRRSVAPWAPLVVLATLFGCPGPQEPAPLPPPLASLQGDNQTPTVRVQGNPAPHVVIAFSLADRGELLSCACPDGVAGGLTRKATLLSGLRDRVPSLLTVAGPESLVAGMADPTRRLGAVEGATTRAELLTEAGVEVLALGAADVAPLTADQLSAGAAESDARWIATNLRRADGGALLPTVHVAERSGYRVVILALTEPSGAALPQGAYSVLDPAVAVEQALSSLSAAPDAVIAFTDAPDAVLLDAAARLRGVDFTIGIAGRTGQRGVAVVDGVRLIREDPAGTRVGLLDLVFSGPEQAGFDDDVKVRDLVEQRLLSVVDEIRHDAAPGSAAGERREELDRRLPRGVADDHTWGYRGTALMADLPEDEGILARLESL